MTPDTKENLCICGEVFAVCVEKGSELLITDPGRKCKGRVVFRGSDVGDQEWNFALFQDMGSSPATMAAAKVADAYGCVSGHRCQLADAVQAYTQSTLKGTATWVSLPREAWPQDWIDKGYKDPVCPLILALYGHPDSGTFWERHCDEKLKEEGFIPIDEWFSCYWHPRLKVLLTVYVDDFKTAGPEVSLQEAWAFLRK